MRRLELVSDCEACAGLCCELTAFEASEDFAFDKPAGVRCPQLAPDARCAIHAQRAQRGLGGCVIYDCAGAGPRGTRLLHGLPSGQRIEGFRVLRALGELIALLRSAERLCEERGIGQPAALSQVRRSAEGVFGASLPELLALDLAALEQRVHIELRALAPALRR